MQKLLNYTLGIGLFLFLLFGCQPYENTYAKSQKEIDAQIAEEKKIFDEYVDSAVYKEFVYDTSVVKIHEDSLELGFVFLEQKLGNGKAILPGDQVGISYKYRELRRNDTTHLIEEFRPRTVYVLPTGSYADTTDHNNVDDNDPYMVSATTSLYTTKTSPSGVSTILGHCVEQLREGDSATVIMSYISHGLPIPYYRSIVLDFKVTYIQKQ